MTQPVLYIVSCGAPLARRASDGVAAAKARGWDVALIPTEAASSWIDSDGIAIDEGRLVAGQRGPHELKRAPAPDAVVVVPMTFNTLNAWATGLADTYPLATLCAALGTRTRTVAVPFAKHDLTGHPAWLASLAVLRYAGVQIVDPATGDAGNAEPVASGTGERIADEFQWSWVLDRIEPSVR